MLNHTIPGGATKDESGQWRDAEGRLLKPEQVAEAERIASEQQRRLGEIESQTTARALVADPGVVSAFRALSLLQPQPQPEQPVRVQPVEGEQPQEPEQPPQQPQPEQLPQLPQQRRGREV